MADKCTKALDGYRRALWKHHERPTRSTLKSVQSALARCVSANATGCDLEGIAAFVSSASKARRAAAVMLDSRRPIAVKAKKSKRRSKR